MAARKKLGETKTKAGPAVNQGESPPIRDVSLFACEMTCEIDDSAETAERLRLEPHAPPACEALCVTASIGEKAGAQYVLTAVAHFGVLKVTITSTFFAIFDVASGFVDGDHSDRVLQQTGSTVVWPRFRDLAILMFSQGGWEVPPFPNKFYQIEVHKRPTRNELSTLK